jgi:hypothetical protein
MVKDGEITKDFNNLTKNSAKKIEVFIIEKVNNYTNFSDLDKGLKSNITPHWPLTDPKISAQQ